MIMFIVYGKNFVYDGCMLPELSYNIVMYLLVNPIRLMCSPILVVSNCFGVWQYDLALAC